MEERIHILDISHETKLITIAAKGVYKLKNIKDLIHLVITNPQYNPNYNIVLDIRDVTYSPVLSEIFAVSDFVVSFKHYFKGKTAILARGEILLRMFKLSTSFVSKNGLRSNVFLNYEEAIEWIENPDSLKIH